LNAVDNADPKPLAPPAPEHLGELARLGRLLDAAGGGFALVLAGYNRPAYRDQLIERMHDQASPDDASVLDANRFGDLTEFEAYLERHSQHSAPLHLIGLDQWLAQDRDRPQGLARMQGFNRHRDYIAKRCHRPLVLWLLESQIGEFARAAPDAWEWRAGVVNFAVHNPTSTIEFPEFTHEFTGGWQERQRRIAELRDFLARRPNQLGEHRQTAMAWEELGALLANTGNWQEALVAYEQVRLAYEQMDDRKEAALILGNIAQLNWQLGDTEQALNQLKTALAALMALNDWRSQAVMLHRIADIQKERGEFDEALRLRQQEELPIYLRLGDVRSQSATLGGIADILLQMGKLPAAKATIEQALTLGEQSLGPEHLGTIRNVIRLGDVLQAQGNWPGARAAFEKMLALSERAFGPAHPVVAESANILGILLVEMGDLDGAQTALQRALALYEQTVGPYHHSVAIVLGNLGHTAGIRGDFAKARDYYEQALSIFERTLRPNHPNVINILSNLGEVLRELGDLDAAQAAVERAQALSQSGAM
jgi:tetratricopeptide (TPR) repeat protein